MKRAVSRPLDQLRVLIINANTMSSELLASSLRHSRHRFEVGALIGTSADVVRQLSRHKPQVVLVSADLEDGPQAGFEVLPWLHEVHPEAAVVMLLPRCKRESVINAFRNGARGIFYRTHTLKSLVKCIRAVHENQIWAGNEDIGYVVEALAQINPLRFRGADGRHLLTQREEDVALLVAEAMRNREIAEALHVSDHAVRNYLNRIFDKLGISSRVELILFMNSKSVTAKFAAQDRAGRARLGLGA